MNPFNILVHALLLVFEAYSVIMVNLFRVWKLVASVLWVWMAFALVMPGIEFWAHISWLLGLVIVDPALYLFNLFVHISDTIRDDYLLNAENPAKIAFLLLGWLFFIGLSLVIMPSIYFVWVIFAYFGLINLGTGDIRAALMIRAGSEASPDHSNIGRIFRGHTTLAKVYDADIQANAIVGAFKKK